MYFPYFRGKQYELIAIKENSVLLAEARIIPIIEPVKKSISSLGRAISSLMTASADFVLIMNPKKGDLENDTSSLIELITENAIKGYEGMHLGYIVDASSSLTDITDFVDEHRDYSVSIIHDGFPQPSALSSALDQYENVKRHFFINDSQHGILYRKKFEKYERVLLQDGFNKRLRNSDHPDKEPFSELHLTFKEYGMQGFGDFSIVGDSFSESGGPAYTVAIHLTYFGEEEVLYVRHFKSEASKTPANPGGKFAEALAALIEGLKGGDIPITRAVAEFQELYEKGHYPGLGYVKKLSMQHHLELMADYLTRG